MTMQEAIIKHYNQINEKFTLREISEDTGIQITRVFRLIRGHEMKIGEYEKFDRAIRKKVSPNNSFNELVQLANLCAHKLSIKQIMEIIELMERKLHLQDLLNDFGIKIRDAKAVAV